MSGAMESERRVDEFDLSLARVRRLAQFFLSSLMTNQNAPIISRLI